MSSTISPARPASEPDSSDNHSLVSLPEPADLVVVKGEGAGRVCQLGEHVDIGRRADCGLVLFEETVSRRHAAVERRADGYYLHDLGSQNGTYINGERITAPTRLNDLDKVEVDVVTLVFQIEAGEHPTSARTSPRNVFENDRLGLATRQIDRPSEVISAIQVAESLDRRTGINADIKLKAILDIASHLGRSTGSDQFLARVLDCLFDIFPQSTRAYVLLTDHNSQELRPAAIRQRGDEANNPVTVRPLPRAIARRAMADGQALLCTDRIPQESYDVEASIFPTSFESIMCAPLFVPSRDSLGILYVDTQDQTAEFSEADLDVLASIAALTGSAVEQARLYEAQRALDRKEDELAAARRVQRHLLPQDPPHVDSWNFFDYYRPALDVGGDYFSYIEMPDGRIAIAVGDVAGKGLSAALLMAQLTADVRNSLVSMPTAADALRKLNELQAEQSQTPLRFITLALCILDPATNELVVANAGHLPPLLRRHETGDVLEIATEEKCMALGIDTTAGYHQTSVTLQPGDTVLLYSDGLTEAMADDDSLYGLAQLKQTLSAAEGNAADVGAAILGHVRRFVGERGYNDDVCLVSFQKNGDEAA